MQNTNINFKKFIDQSKIFSNLGKYKIEFGIFSEDGELLVDVNILNLDDSITKTTLPLADVMFLVDKGTLMIPGTFMFEKISRFAEIELEKTIDSLFDKFVKCELNESDILFGLETLTVKINNFIATLGGKIIEDQSKLTTLMETKNEGKYLMDLNELGKYIKCKLIRL